MTETQLLPCPFCGSEAIFERRGTARQSCIVVCTNCGCRHESGDEEGWNGSSWNDRFQPKVKPGDELGALWRAIVLNTKGDLFWIGEILLAELEKETGYKPHPIDYVDSLARSET